MSKENASLFYEMVQQHQELQEMLKRICAEGQVHLQESIVRLGGEYGFKFTVEELNQAKQEAAVALKESGELNEFQYEEASDMSLNVGM